MYENIKLPSANPSDYDESWLFMETYAWYNIYNGDINDHK